MKRNEEKLKETTKERDNLLEAQKSHRNSMQDLRNQSPPSFQNKQRKRLEKLEKLNLGQGIKSYYNKPSQSLVKPRKMIGFKDHLKTKSESFDPNEKNLDTDEIIRRLNITQDDAEMNIYG